MWTRKELSELVMYSQCMPLELELEHTLANLWWPTNLNTRVSIKCTRKIGTHSRFGARKHEVTNELHRRKVYSTGSFSRLAEFMKIQHMKVLISKSLLDVLHYCNFCLAQLMHAVIYLIIVYELLRYIKQTLCDGSLPDPTGPLLHIFHHRPSYKPTTKS